MDQDGSQLMLGCLNSDQHLLAIGYEAARILKDAGVPYLVGGGVALWAYGRRRNTKDIDLFLPNGKQIEALDALARRNFHTRDMDARWLYKAQKSDVTVDIIVYTTGDIRVDDQTFAHSRDVVLDGYPMTVMGPEDMLYRKIHSTSEERFHDWYDALSILARRETAFDWDYFLERTLSNSVEKTLSLVYFALAELGPDAVPAGVVTRLLAASSRRSSSKTA